MFLDDGAQVGPPVEGGPADLRACGYLCERDGLPGGGELGAGGLDLAGSSRSAGIGLGDEHVESFDEAAVAGGFLAPAAGLGVGGERFGVGALQLQDGQEAGLGAEVRAVLADVGVGAGALRGGAQAVAAGEPGLDQRRVPPVPAGDAGDGSWVRSPGSTGPSCALARARARVYSSRTVASNSRP